jgi:hypothetical protein
MSNNKNLNQKMVRGGRDYLKDAKVADSTDKSL